MTVLLVTAAPRALAPRGWSSLAAVVPDSLTDEERAGFANAAAADLVLDTALVKKYDGFGPRYTSYPTADRFHAGVTAERYVNVRPAAKHDHFLIPAGTSEGGIEPRRSLQGRSRGRDRGNRRAR